MADPSLTLETERLSVEPGGQTRVSVTVNNPGERVEGYRLDVVGEGVSGWAEVVPPEVNVYPKEEATAVVVISPPAGDAAPSGSWPFGVRARSLVDAGAGAVVEGSLEVGQTFGLKAKLVPVTSTGRWRGQHVVHLSNWGNTPVKLRLVASDPDEALGFLVRPPVLDLPVGGQAMARIWVRGRRPFLRGSEVRVPFTVAGEREDARPSSASTMGPAAAMAAPDRPMVDGALNQKPILSRTAATLGIAGLALAVGGAVWIARGAPAASSPYSDGQVPGQPQNVRAVGTGPSTINVTWDPMPGVSAWKVQVKAGVTEPVSATQDVDAAQTSTTVDGLPAAREACFHVQALGSDSVAGPASALACADTRKADPSATPSPLVTLPPPERESTGPGGSATADPEAAGSTGQPTGPAGTSPTAPPPEESPTGPTTPTTVTPSPSPSPRPGSSVPVLTGKWVAVTYASFSNSTTIPDIQTEVARVKKSGAEPLLIHSGDAVYAEMTPWRPANPSWMVVVGPFDSEQQALAECARIGSSPVFPCRATQPDPS